jgi:hypothetical protein
MKKKKCILFIILIVIIIAVVIGAILLVNKNKKKPEVEEEKQAVVLNSIEEFNITLDDLDTDLYKKEYETLKNNLQSEKINYEEYAKSISKMFIIDLYSLKAKLNKYDVGGVQFVYPPIAENYTLNVEDTLYKYMEDNSKGKRKQTLPMVKSVTVSSIKANKYTIKSEEKTYEGYKVKVSWEYEKNLGYDDEAELIIIKVDNKLYIAEKN